jgi:hypothetical protein
MDDSNRCSTGISRENALCRKTAELQIEGHNRPGAFTSPVCRHSVPWLYDSSPFLWSADSEAAPPCFLRAFRASTAQAKRCTRRVAASRAIGRYCFSARSISTSLPLRASGAQYLRTVLSQVGPKRQLRKDSRSLDDAQPIRKKLLRPRMNLAAVVFPLRYVVNRFRWFHRSGGRIKFGRKQCGNAERIVLLTQRQHASKLQKSIAHPDILVSDSSEIIGFRAQLSNQLPVYVDRWPEPKELVRAANVSLAYNHDPVDWISSR